MLITKAEIEEIARIVETKNPEERIAAFKVWLKEKTQQEFGRKERLVPRGGMLYDDRDGMD